MIYNNMLHLLPFRTPLQPYSAWFSLIIMILLTITNGFYVFVPSKWSVSNFLVAYITIPIFLVLYLGHKAWFKTPWCIAIADMDVTTGKEEADRAEEAYIIHEPVGWYQKTWAYIA